MQRRDFVGTDGAGRTHGTHATNRSNASDGPAGGSGRRALGIEGEARAAAHLETRGYRILARNARAGRVEIDLVAARGRTLVFVEVKTRRSRGAGLPEEAVDFRKRERLVQGAAAWLATHPRRSATVRFDVVACERDDAGHWSIRHLEGAFDAGD
jgi:putative endonuclease